MPSTSKRFGIVFWVFSLVIVAAISAAFGILFSMNQNQMAMDKKTTDATAVTSLKLAGPVVEHKLAAGFVDADGDLVADTPADPARQLDPSKLTFSYVATEDPEVYQARWKDFTNYLATVTGKPVEYVLLDGSEEELRALKEGRLLVAGFNTGAVPTAVNQGGFVPAFTFGSAENGTCCEIIVPADSAISKPEDLRNKSIVFVDMNSNTGYKAPIALLRQKFNMVPPVDFTYTLSYGHESSIKGVATRKFAAAAVASDMVDRLVASKAVGAGDFKVIYKSERFPTAAMGFAYNLKPELQAKIRKAFETYPWPEGPLKQEFAASGQDHFTPTDYKRDWAAIRMIDDNTGGARK